MSDRLLLEFLEGMAKTIPAYLFWWFIAFALLAGAMAGSWIGRGLAGLGIVCTCAAWYLYKRECEEETRS